MSSGMKKKVRLIRCPKCGLILQEMPNVPLYQCGGCFTTLQAKNQRQLETLADETSDWDHVSERSSSSHETTLQCLNECHSDQYSEMSQTESRDINNIGNLRGNNIQSENERNTSNQDNHQCDYSNSNEDCLLKEIGELLYPMSVRTRFRVGDSGKSSSFAANVNKTEADAYLNSENGSVHKRLDKGETVDTTVDSLASDVGVSSLVSGNHEAQQIYTNSPLEWTDEFVPHHSYYKRESLDAANRNPNELYYAANFTSPEATYADREKLQLLRMVCELQDQLNRASLNHKETGRVSWPHQRKFSHIPMASTGLNSLGYSEGLSMSHSLPSHYDFNVDPRFSMYNSDDQMKRDDTVTKYFKERPQLPKRHLRPLAGGAPFITCHSCFKELQLPVDFILFKKRIHRLKCASCLQVLNFSLVNNTHLIPYVPQSRNFSSTSHVTGCPSVSCSDDSSRPTCKSSSQGNEKERKVNEMKIKGKTPIGYGSGGPSTSTSNSKITLDEAERRTSFPLHRLMGYSSAHQVLYN